MFSPHPCYNHVAMAYFIGIDGGGSKTECVLGDETRVLGRATTGSCKLQVVGEAAARGAIYEAMGKASAKWNVHPEQISGVCVGISGISRSDVASIVLRWIQEVVSGPVQVVGDNAIALEAAFSAGPGVLVISGTGSIAFGRDASGRTARAGGWGPAISDEGSGTWIGRNAVARVLRAADSGEQTSLRDAILQVWKEQSLEDLVTLANRVPPPDFATLFPIVMEQARAGDVTAAEILDSAGAELAELARHVIDRLWPTHDPAPVRITGGVLGGSEEVRRSFRQTLKVLSPNARISDDIVEPVLGALALARKQAAAAKA